MKDPLTRRVYIGLLHYPVYNKHGQRIASALTTFDLHDLARIGRTYHIQKFFVITPLQDQQKLAERMIGHWTRGYGAHYNLHRKEAMELIALCASLDEYLGTIQEAETKQPLLIVTDAGRWRQKGLSYPQAAELAWSGQPLFLLFGTAWGLDQEVMRRADYILDPIEGLDGYNHLPVRAAAAIILDRISRGARG